MNRQSAQTKDISHLLKELGEVQDKLSRRNIVAVLGKARNPAAIDMLVRVALGEIPGYWFEDSWQTMHELKKYYFDEDDALDHMNMTARSWERDLRTAAVDAIVEIGGERAMQVLKELSLRNDEFHVHIHAGEALKKLE